MPFRETLSSREQPAVEHGGQRPLKKDAQQDRQGGEWRKTAHADDDTRAQDQQKDDDQPDPAQNLRNKMLLRGQGLGGEPAQTHENHQNERQRLFHPGIQGGRSRHPLPIRVMGSRWCRIGWAGSGLKGQGIFSEGRGKAALGWAAQG